MIKIYSEYEFTIEQPCYLYLNTEQQVEIAEEEITNGSIIKTYSDFYFINTMEELEAFINGDNTIQTYYPQDLFYCGILVPNEFKIIKKSANNFEAWFYYSEDFIDQPIISIEPFLMTADLAMTSITAFPKMVANTYDPQIILKKWYELAKIIGIDTDLLHLEMYLAQTLVCLDNENKLYRNSDCSKAKLLRLKQAVTKLYPVRALFFENLGLQITELPLLDESEMSSLDKLLLGKL